jgi:purine-nucleoside phosphorylase
VTRTDLETVVSGLNERFGPAPSTAIVLGSGLGGLVETLEQPQSAQYAELGLPQTSVEGHSGSISVGRLGGKPTALLAGRIHVYEGRSMDEVVANVRAMALWGVRRVVLTNAVGALKPELETGSLVAMEDHLNLMGTNPLLGPNDDSLGPRFPDMSSVYDKVLREQATQVAQDLSISLASGVYAAVRGPSYETPAEVAMYARLGASTVGMSVVPEAIALNHMGIPILAISMISNPAAGLGTSPLRHADVTEAASNAGAQLATLLSTLVQKWD